MTMFYKDEYNQIWILYYILITIIFICLLILKEIKIRPFPWAPRSTMPAVPTSTCVQQTTEKKKILMFYFKSQIIVSIGCLFFFLTSEGHRAVRTNPNPLGLLWQGEHIE